jgi:4-hydroxyphenylpyruvate dioxygenase
MEIDRIHFYVVNATETRDLLIDRMGLQALEDRINEHTIEYIIGNAHLSFSISSPLNSSSHVAEYLQLHPSGVKDISFRVDDLDLMRQKIDRLGINIIAVSTVGKASPVENRDKRQWIKIQGWGSIEHTIIQSELESINSLDSTEQIIGIDHLVLNVPVGELDLATTWYENLFNFQVQQTFDIKTAKSGLASKALVSSCGKIRFNINVPSSDSSQIQEFLNTNRGAGIQHIALQTNDILATVDRMQQQEVTFLPIPQTYYVNLQNRARAEQVYPLFDREWQKLEHLQILMDWSNYTPEAILLQIFTQPIFEAQTFFFEVIERRNLAKGFGEGNFQALFEAIEQYNNLKV